jgi:hypothetical protein
MTNECTSISDRRCGSCQVRRTFIWLVDVSGGSFLSTPCTGLQLCQGGAGDGLRTHFAGVEGGELLQGQHGRVHCM